MSLYGISKKISASFGSRVSLQALIGLFRNLALNRDNHLALRTQGCIPKLWQLLNRAYQESQRRGQPGVPPGFVVSGGRSLSDSPSTRLAGSSPS